MSRTHDDSDTADVIDGLEPTTCTPETVTSLQRRVGGETLSDEERRAIVQFCDEWLSYHLHVLEELETLRDMVVTPDE